MKYCVIINKVIISMVLTGSVVNGNNSSITSLVVYEGETVKLKCDGGDVIWTHNTIAIQYDSSRSHVTKLVLRKISANQSGIYTCIGDDFKKSFEVLVGGKFIFNLIMILLCNKFGTILL